MLSIKDTVVVIRGGGDIATGVIHKLYRSGFKVCVLEVENPSAIRREVSFCEAVYENEKIVEEVKSILVSSLEEIKRAWEDRKVPIFIDPKGEIIEKLKPQVVVDGILAKKNYGTKISMAPIVIALGPGFEASKDAHIVVETMRGHNLGRLIFEGKPMENTGTPGIIKGVGKERVIYSNSSGTIKNISKIGDIVKKGQVLAKVGEEDVVATIDGVLRGLIREGYSVPKNFKIADIDPRYEEQKNSFTISDKARAIGGAVLEGILYMKNEKNI